MMDLIADAYRIFDVEANMFAPSIHHTCRAWLLGIREEHKVDKCSDNAYCHSQLKRTSRKFKEKFSFSLNTDGYYVAYKPITLSCILFMFIEINFIHCHSCVIFVKKSMSMCND